MGILPKKKFEAQTSTELITLKGDFADLKCTNPRMDPNKWIGKLEDLQIQINNLGGTDTLSDNDMKIHILNNLPSQYDTVVDQALDKDLRNLDLDDFKVTLDGKFQRLLRVD